MKTEVIIIDSKAYEQLKEELVSEMREAVRDAMHQVMEERGMDSDWVKKEPAMEMLGIRSKSKLQDLRDNSEIDFSQRPGGRIILYSKQSILEYLERNKKDK